MTLTQEKTTIRPSSFWRMKPPVIDENDVFIKGGFFPKQKQWWELPNFIKVLVAGYGAGKTIVGCKRIISNCLQNAPVVVATVSPTFPIAKKTIVETIIELLNGKQGHYGQQLWWRYNQQDHMFTIKFRGRTGRISVLSGDNPLSLRGPNLGSALIDEPFIQDDEVFKQMIARIRHPLAKHKELLMTGTPEQLNWGYDLCVGELKDKHDVGFVQASTRDNYVVGSEYVGRLEGALSGRASSAYVDGNFINLAEGTVYYGFNSTKNGNVFNLQMPEGAELGVGMDFNVNPMAAVVFWKRGNHVHYFDEIELPNADTEYMCSTLVDKYVKPELYRHNPLVNIYPDASGSARDTAAPAGKSDFSHIQDAGFTICANHANPKRKDRYNSVNGKLGPKQGEPTTTVAPNCKRIIKYLSLYSHEEMNKPQQKKMSHLLDAFSYPQSYLFPATRETLSVHKIG